VVPKRTNRVQIVFDFKRAVDPADEVSGFVFGEVAHVLGGRAGISQTGLSALHGSHRGAIKAETLAGVV